MKTLNNYISGCVIFFFLISESVWAEGFTWLPGSARAITRTRSASRDRPVFEYAYGLTAQASIGGEWAWFKVDRITRAFRFGMYAMMGLENHDWRTLFPPSELWRGMTGLEWAWSFNTLGEKLFGQGGQCELGLVFGHESDHGYMNDPPQPDDIHGGGGGDFLTPDLAFQFFLDSLTNLTLRLQCRFYFRGSFKTAPGVDIICRYQITPWFYSSLALFGEILFPSEPKPKTGFFVRFMPGLTFPGKIGEFTFFGSFDAGNGKGLLVNHRAARFSFGVRYAPFSKG